jgi:hypothetical protein
VSIYRDGTKRTQPLSTAKAAIVAAGQLSKARARLTGTPAWNPWPVRVLSVRRKKISLAS